LFASFIIHPQVRYVQGMNEIVGTIYYVLANDHNSDWANHAEADCYYLFHSLMIEMKDVFVPDMDTSTTGIQGRIDNMQQLLFTHDPEVQEHLQECGIDASFYAIRWLTTLLSREFLLPDTIRLWDSMFASTHKENFLRYVCGTMVMLVREDLLKGDFSTCLRLLQSYPPTNVDDILESSRALWIYESQITLACHKGGISLHQALQTVSPPPAIIMAFGLRGGVAPRITEQFQTAAQLAQEQLQTAKDGLLGRAKKFWSGWGSTTEETTTTTATAAAAPAPPPRPPPRARAWNRSRNNTNDSNTTNEKEEGGGVVLASLQDEAAATTTTTTTTSTPRRRIWNRGQTNTAEEEEEKEGTTEANPEPDATEATATAALTTTPTRRPIWKSAPTRSGETNNSSSSWNNNDPSNSNNDLAEQPIESLAVN
jgi:hypothetical protein